MSNPDEATRDVERLRELLAEADAFVPYGDPSALKLRLRDALPLEQPLPVQRLPRDELREQLRGAVDRAQKAEATLRSALAQLSEYQRTMDQQALRIGEQEARIGHLLGEQSP